MLSNMFIGNPPGNYDRILDFSTAKTGSLFFVPTSSSSKIHQTRRTLAPLPKSSSPLRGRQRFAGAREPEMSASVRIQSLPLNHDRRLAQEI